MDTALALKREALILAWQGLIHTATGELPIVERQTDGAKVTFAPGQSAKMSAYILEALSKPRDPNDLNVSVDLAPVIIPVVLKKYWYLFIGVPLTAYLVGKYI